MESHIFVGIVRLFTTPSRFVSAKITGWSNDEPSTSFVAENWEVA